MRKILIIGKNGFVAKSIFEYLSETNQYDIEVTSTETLNLLDEKNVNVFFRQRYFDIVIDCAVWSPMSNAIETLGREVEHDMRMFFNIAKYSKYYGKLIHFGSGAEYDKRYPIVSVKETDFDRWIPESDYGFAKFMINEFIEKSENLYNLRIFGLYGKYEDYYCKFITGACAKAVCGIPISIRQNVYFDFLYIDDFCEMVKRFIKIDSPRFHSYNIVSGRKIDLVTIANIVREVAKQKDGKEVDLFVCQQGLANEYTASNARLIEEIGAVELTSYKESIEILYDYFKENMDSIDIQKLLYQG